jgi:hypothetical protein
MRQNQTMLPTGNFTICGESIADFVALAQALQAHRLLWSCVCDKYGDWLISTADDTPRSELDGIIQRLSLDVEIIEYGELTTTLGGVEEFRDVLLRMEEKAAPAAE